jgi:hypothetical protein
MQDSTQPAANGKPAPRIEERTVTAAVYGFRSRELALQIVHALIDQARCIPTLVFRLDSVGREVCAVDANTKRNFYVSVRRCKPGPVVLDWNCSGSVTSKAMKSRANSMIREFMAPHSTKPMLIPFKVLALLGAAKTTNGAS